MKERDVNRDAATKLAALEAAQDERDRGFEARIKELVEAKEALSAQFAEISNKLLAEAQETFLKRADQRFRQSEENSGQNLKALLQPVTSAWSGTRRRFRRSKPSGAMPLACCRGRSRPCAPARSACPPRRPSW